MHGEIPDAQDEAGVGEKSVVRGRGVRKGFLQRRQRGASHEYLQRRCGAVVCGRSCVNWGKLRTEGVARDLHEG